MFILNHMLGKVQVAFGLVLVLVSGLVFSASAESVPRTQTAYTQTGDGVDVIPYIRGGRKEAFVDFQSGNKFDNVQYVYFNFNYNTTAQGTKRGVEGSFIPGNEKFDYFEGAAYIRRKLLFGTCSKNVCTYDPNPTDVKITVNTKMKTGPVDQYTRVITVPN